MIDVLGSIVAKYAQASEETLTGLLKTTISVPNEIESLYKILIEKKEIEPIENYPDKQKIWDKVKDWNMDKEQKIKVAKCMYLIGIIKQ